MRTPPTDPWRDGQIESIMRWEPKRSRRQRVVLGTLVFFMYMLLATVGYFLLRPNHQELATWILVGGPLLGLLVVVAGFHSRVRRAWISSEVPRREDIERPWRGGF